MLAVRFHLMTTFDQAYRGIRQIGEVVVRGWTAAEGRQMKGAKRTKEKLVKNTDRESLTDNLNATQTAITDMCDANQTHCELCSGLTSKIGVYKAF